MAYDYDAVVIGLGPAGMAVAIMGAEMGLKVCGIEKHKVGGECMNVGCIPSKALLRMGKLRASLHKFPRMGLEAIDPPGLAGTFRRIQSSLDYIGDKKTMSAFAKVDMVYQEGAARFVDGHTVEVGERRITGKRIFICTGTQPQIPDIPGLRDIDPLTNNTMFQLETVPERLVVLGSGAIACEMAQAFHRLGSQVTMLFRGPGLLWREGEAVTRALEDAFTAEGIELKRDCTPARFSRDGDRISIDTGDGATITTDRVLCALGRRLDVADLRLDAAGVRVDGNAIRVDKRLRTTCPSVFACGDCNGHALFSHAAMHQGMIALMNCLLPWPWKRDYRRYVVPWTIFTEPQISHVGARAAELDARGTRYETVEVRYGDYGAAIAEGVDTGFVRVLCSPLGRIHGVTIVGEGSGDMINEWGLAIQTRRRMSDIMFLQHSFPAMGFLCKRVAETWMMRRMQSPWRKRMCRFLY